MAWAAAALKDRAGIWSPPVGCICKNQRRKYDHGQRAVIKISKEPRNLKHRMAVLSGKSLFFRVFRRCIWGECVLLLAIHSQWLGKRVNFLLRRLYVTLYHETPDLKIILS